MSADFIPPLQVIRTGLSGYRDVWERQKKCFSTLIDEVSAGGAPSREYLFIAEHKPVYTLGRHGHEENLLADENRLKAAGAECIRIERGGDITFHGPGQLVAYPIISLRHHRLGVKDYVNLLEESVIRTVAGFGIKGERVDGATGVWIDKGMPGERKICAIGVKCSHFVTMHGLALNVNTDLAYFDLINPCGFTDKGVTSIAREVEHAVDFDLVCSIFTDVLTGLLGSVPLVNSL